MLDERKRDKPEVPQTFIPPGMTGEELAALKGAKRRKTQAQEVGARGLAKRWRKGTCEEPPTCSTD